MNYSKFFTESRHSESSKHERGSQLEDFYMYYGNFSYNQWMRWIFLGKAKRDLVQDVGLPVSAREDAVHQMVPFCLGDYTEEHLPQSECLAPLRPS